GQMLQTRRQLADRRRALADRAKDPLASMRSRSLRDYPRQPLSERLSEQMSMRRPRMPSAESWQARYHRLSEGAVEFGYALRNPKWLARLGCAVAAILLLFILYKSSSSPVPGRSQIAVNGTGSRVSP